MRFFKKKRILYRSSVVPRRPRILLILHFCGDVHNSLYQDVGHDFGVVRLVVGPRFLEFLVQGVQPLVLASDRLAPPSLRRLLVVVQPGHFGWEIGNLGQSSVFIQVWDASFFLNFAQIKKDESSPQNSKWSTI